MNEMPLLGMYTLSTNIKLNADVGSILCMFQLCVQDLILVACEMEASAHNNGIK